MASLTELSGTLGKRLAAHLLRRCTYNPTKERIDEFANKTAAEAVDDLFIIPPPLIAEPVDYDTGQPWINSGIDPTLGSTNLERTITGWWLYEALNDPSIGHKMQFFLHQNFVTAANTTGNTRMYFDYLALIRQFALGSYKSFSYKMSLDNHMLYYLNGRDNTDDSPNENYAREFLELFTIGKGPAAGPGNYTNYTEDDVVAAAKLFSGWRNTSRILPPNPDYFDPDTGIQRGYPTLSRHETADKTFSAAFGNATITGATTTAGMYTELQDFVDLVFDQFETARSICRRLYRYFVSNKLTQEVEADIIDPLAAILYNNDYELHTVIKPLLKSQHFYDKDDSNANDEIIGGLLKSPIDLLLNALSFFKVDIDAPQLDPKQHYYYFWRFGVIESLFLRAGMDFFRPDSVAGYPAYYQEPGFDRNWLSGATILARYKLPEVLLTGKRLFSNSSLGANVKLNPAEFLRDKGVISNPFDAYTVVGELAEYLFPEALTPERFEYYLHQVFLAGFPAFDWTEDYIDYLNTGDDAAVIIPLERLVKAILYSQDYQLM